MDEGPLMSTAELAAYLKIPEASLARQRHVRAFPGALGFRVGRHVRYRREDVAAWVASQLPSSVERLEASDVD
jgi:hypothetical protein